MDLGTSPWIKILKPLLTAAAVIVPLWIISFLIVYFDKSHLLDWSHIGDSFGAVNSLFSGLALAGIIVTILLQCEELEAQREELSLNRKELKGQREQLEQQKILLEQQLFESSFFRLLDYYQNLISSVKQESGYNSVSEGKEAIRVLYDRFINFYKTGSFNPSDDRLNKSFNNIIGFRLGHSFKLLTHILFLVTKRSNSSYYIEIIKSSISSSELLILFYYGIVYNEEKLKQINSNYDLFDNINSSKLLNSTDINFYTKEVDTTVKNQTEAIIDQIGKHLPSRETDSCLN